MKKFNKKKLPSRHTTIGADKAPQRSFYYAMDLTEKDVAKPFVVLFQHGMKLLHVTLI